jgi:8-oxo-dGTP pyrophosphatase MutT (NUDIX family)
MSILEHPELIKILSAVKSRTPASLSNAEMRRAAVAIIFRAASDGEPELLFIKRAEYPGDPWSGHVAFPGGRREDHDKSLEETAIRETREETGIDLATSGMIIGALDEIQPQSVRLPELVVKPFIAILNEEPVVTLAGEVSEVFWVRLEDLRQRGAWRDTEVSGRGFTITRRAFHHEGHVIWGITERIIAQVLSLIED